MKLSQLLTSTALFASAAFAASNSTNAVNEDAAGPISTVTTAVPTINPGDNDVAHSSHAGKAGDLFWDASYVIK
ncbi:putative secreted protein [Wickerhamomyces ciferrii]|uniref:Secreted protein n=1 Tax=Wickerhamomyces ciferrii (strain ATCC 14091 / BCRC 22168 / CBS 111 / JCM 3599 / NBRC 0793 / NRRL Y-1031 F-60-10) TaxID=1206466 RepID=K0KJW1_WICCF|nr:uncharacterized protein BN7_1288 [Wickerhamomyces ciferrii]CCH41749.1 putative secreted protein [Wickerhamomyces ciferrii]